MQTTPSDVEAFRRFVRKHHPDRGGDPRVFAEGVQAWRRTQNHGCSAPAELDAANPTPTLVFYRRRRRRDVLLALLRPVAWPLPRRRRRPVERRVR